jgi:hypothetical protein
VREMYIEEDTQAMLSAIHIPYFPASPQLQLPGDAEK